MSLKGEKAVVCGAGGFIGGHLVKHLIANGVEVVRAVDIKPLDEWYQVTDGVESLALDLKDKDACLTAATGVTTVYQLAADMGGMGFIENNKALCMLSVLTNTHMLMAAREKGVERFFFSSSACVYNGEKQTNPDVVALKEEDAYPAMPEDGYGWEKLFSRAHVPAFSRGLRPGDAGGALPQCLWPAGDVDGRPREGAGSDLPQGDRGEDLGHGTRSRSGATASRRGRSCTSTTARRGRR